MHIVLDAIRRLRTTDRKIVKSAVGIYIGWLAVTQAEVEPQESEDDG